MVNECRIFPHGIAQLANRDSSQPVNPQREDIDPKRNHSKEIEVTIFAVTSPPITLIEAPFASDWQLHDIHPGGITQISEGSVVKRIMRLSRTASLFLATVGLGLAAKSSAATNVRRSLQEEAQDSTADENCSLKNTDLLLPMRSKDIPFATALLKSIDANLPCYNDLVVVVPPESNDEVKAILPESAKVFIEPDAFPEHNDLSDGMKKIYADKFITADYVLILEPDMVFTGWQDDCLLGKEGKIRLYCVNFEKDGGTPLWRRGTELAVWRTVTDDCAVHTPALYPKEIFDEFRGWVNHAHEGVAIDKIMEDYVEFHSRPRKEWNPDDTLFNAFDILNQYMWFFMRDQVEMIRPKTPEWMSIGECSQHTGQLVDRFHDEENPDMITEYSALAHEAIGRQHENL